MDAQHTLVGSKHATKNGIDTFAVAQESIFPSSIKNNTKEGQGGLLMSSSRGSGDKVEVTDEQFTEMLESVKLSIAQYKLAS